MQSCSSKGRCVLLGCEKGGIRLELGKWSCLSGELLWDHNSKTVSSLEVCLCIWKQGREFRWESHKWYRSWRTRPMGEYLWSSVHSGAWGGAWEETCSLQMFSEEILRGNRQFLLPEFILAVKCCHKSIAEPSGLVGKTVLPSTSWEGISPDKISCWHMLSVLSRLHITAEFFYFATQKDCQKKKSTTLPYPNFYHLAFNWLLRRPGLQNRMLSAVEEPVFYLFSIYISVIIQWSGLSLVIWVYITTRKYSNVSGKGKLFWWWKSLCYSPRPAHKGGVGGIFHWFPTGKQAVKITVLSVSFSS